jgi:hypothetical protein
MQRIATSKPKMGLSGYGKVGNTPYHCTSNFIYSEGNGGRKEGCFLTFRPGSQTLFQSVAGSSKNTSRGEIMVNTP